MADAAALHRALVDGLVGRRCISDARVEAAFRAVPRHLFLPGVPLADAYRDQAIPTKTVDGEAVSSSSQPEIMATMLEQLKLEPGLRVLEIGAGTGYNAALMPHIVGEEGKYRSAAGVFEEGSAVFFMRPPGDPVPAEPEREPRPFELHVRGFGDGADTERLRRHARAWDGAGRPGTDGLRIRALPIDVDYTPTVHEQVIVKRWTRLVLDWPDHAGPDTSGSRYESR